MGADQRVAEVIEAERIRLRVADERDIDRLVELANDRDVAAGTLRIPHPYAESDARAFLERASRDDEASSEVIFVIAQLTSNQLMGTCGINVDRVNRSGEIGYWIGTPYRGRGYVHEAVTLLLDLSVFDLGIEKIWARVFTGNPRSSRVLERLGFQREGLLRSHLIKWDERRDLEQWGLLAEEWKEIRRGHDGS